MAGRNTPVLSPFGRDGKIIMRRAAEWVWSEEATFAARVKVVSISGITETPGGRNAVPGVRRA